MYSKSSEKEKNQTNIKSPVKNAFSEKLWEIQHDFFL